MSREGPTPESRWFDPEFSARLADLYARIAAARSRAGRADDRITLVAVTKTIPVERILVAAALGLDIAENRIQEAREKREQLAMLASDDPEVAHLISRMRWDLIGHLQTNKVARALECFDRVQSVDSARIAQALSARALERGVVLPVLLEVNTGGEVSKSGFAPSEVRAAAREIAAMPGLRVEGLMTVAPLVPEPELARPAFRALCELRDRLRASVPLRNGEWRELSMGMSDDFEVAIEEGSTMVRIGRGLFGPRPPITRRGDTSPGTQ